MKTSSRISQEKAATYARVLFSALEAAGREKSTLVQLEQAEKFSPELIEALSVMQQEGDLELLSQVRAIFSDLVNTSQGMPVIEVTSAIPLDEDLQKQVRSKLEKDFGRTIYLIEKVDPSIIGGLVFEFRGQRRDASVRSQLTNIRRVLTSDLSGGEVDEQ